MSKKSKFLYEKLFETLIEISVNYNLHLSPKFIQTDFEKSIKLAAKSYFPEAKYSGCYFHFTQIINRRIGAMMLKKEYRKNRKFYIYMQMLKAMPFLDTSDVLTAMEELTNLFESEPSSKRVLSWFQDK